MADASFIVGMKGIIMVSTLDGRWVNTIVLISPILLQKEIGDPSAYQRDL